MRWNHKHKFHKRYAWHKWFAWYPIIISYNKNEDTWVWFEMVARQRYISVIGCDEFHYKELKEIL